ncbi:CRISPR-associated endonuclease Cas2 [Yinghuangia sp. ASG 101]|uniref:CRISPR-associated endonuclease Cas2 n=1 Tax=Yinghuangia sp. ASG 101 TaxID=2896848 RepID=UPI001E592B85|nr:CRISPR-associated endonuclease Cas2 [Yinghuangia sp. ASG 101]UGQ14969.1 CRISPR-associated endonuclease Cas2 [Yinghuangia sp. ASG 101]
MMDVLLAYDVDTTTPEGRRRLRRMAKLCEGYGSRVQKSVFEIATDEVGMLMLIAKAEAIIDEETDSVRLYRLPKNGFNQVQTLGTAFKVGHRDDFVF